MDILYMTALFIGGILSGIYGAAVGSGGLVSFPLLLWTGIPVINAIATNRFGGVLLELSSSIKYYREKKLNYKLGFTFGILAAAGSFIGSNIIINIDEKYLNLIIAIFLGIAFFVLMFQKKLGIEEKIVSNKHWVLASVSLFGLGIYGGFFGTGFGTFVTFIFILIGLNFVKSAAVSRVVGLVMSFVATLVFAYHGLINYPYAISLGLGMALGGWVGVGIGIKRGDGYIKILFIFIILATITKLIYEALK